MVTVKFDHIRARSRVTLLDAQRLTMRVAAAVYPCAVGHYDVPDHPDRLTALGWLDQHGDLLAGLTGHFPQFPAHCPFASNH